jgi:dTDP-glucose pyrophosphorylase
MHDIAQCSVRPEATLRDALRALDASGLEIALAVDQEGRLIGTLTDGDIRRALLGGHTLDEALGQFVNRRFGAVEESTPRASVLDLMQAKRVKAVPVVDAEGRLRGLHTLHDILGHTERPNCAVIMVGGRGERLRPLTDTIPKPMLRVAGRPILERIVLHLVGFGIRRIFLSVNYKAEIIEIHFGDGSAFGCNIEYLREEAPLGTGGALSLLPAVPSEPVLVLNGDLLTQVDVGDMLRFHADAGHKATVGVHEYRHTVPFGVVELQGERIVAVREKPIQCWQVNAGIYVLEPELLARVPKGTYFPMPALVEECLERGEAVGAFPVEGDWIDVGLHKELRRARGEADRP